MTKLNSLAFIQLPKSSGSDPVTARRNKLITRLQQQRALVEDPNFVVSAKKWLPDENGVKQLRERQKRVGAWWRTDAAGNVVLTVRYGAKPIEFQKGKAAIAVGTKDKLITTIDTLIAPVAAGELDAQIASLSNSTEFKRKKAA